jgi:hypothetical protein
MEREWLDPGRGGKAAIAELKKVEFNPVLAEDRFNVPGAVR